MLFLCMRLLMSKKNSYLKQRRNKNQRFLLTILSILALSAGSFILYNKAIEKEYAKVNKDIESLNKKKEDLQITIKSLKEDYDNRNTDEFKEKIARDRLDMVKKSEVVYEDDNNK